VLNDYYDQDIDRENPFGQTVFTQGFFTDREKRAIIRFFAVLALACELPQFAYIYLAHPAPLVDLIAYSVFILVGFSMATAYSIPPLWAKRRLLGPLYTLMLVYVTGFLRFALVLGGWDFLLLNGVFVLGICWFLYIDHMISSASLKDIPDAFADEKGGSRSVPLVWGFGAAMRLSAAFLVLTLGTGVLFVVAGWLQWWFLVTYLGVIIYYYLYREMNGWAEEVSRDRSHWARVPIRRRFLAYGYIMNWGVWIPCFMLAFNSRLLM